MLDTEQKMKSKIYHYVNSFIMVCHSHSLFKLKSQEKICSQIESFCPQQRDSSVSTDVIGITVPCTDTYMWSNLIIQWNWIK